MRFRKILFWIHLAAGCVAGAIVLLMSFTGVLLTYERQILAWSDRGKLRAAPPAGIRRLPVSELLKAVTRQRGAFAENATLTIRSDPREPAEIRIARETIYVDAYSGNILTGGSPATRTAFQKITAWHRWLGVEGTGRATARAITGACNLAFLLLMASGAWLWLPRQWSWQAIRPIAMFRSGLAGKARDFKWHNVFGIWALIPLFLVVLTALPMSYPWANDLLYRITGSEPPPTPAAGRGGDTKAGRKGPANRRESARRSQPAEVVDLDNLWTRAANSVPTWQSITARIAISDGEPLSFAIDTGDGGQPQKRSTLVLGATGSVVRLETFADTSPGRRLRLWSRFAHTGEYYGVVGQTLAGLASVAGVMLVWTGISLALRRFTAWTTRRRKQTRRPEEVTALVGADERH